MPVTSDTAPIRVPQTWFWTVACFSAMALMVADANLDLLEQPWHGLLKVLVVVFAAGTMISGYVQSEAEGPLSAAYRTFGIRMVVTVGVCVFVFSAGSRIFRSVPLETPALWLLGLVTAVPVLGFVWIMARYLAEETDEYLRHLAIMSALIGLAVVLVVATVWGWLESLGLVPHAWPGYAIPLFCLASGAGRGWLKARNR
jgi:cytochrome bd-type quinol oxidase subunit 2